MNISHLKPKKIILSLDDFKREIDEIIRNKKKEIIVTLNTEMFVDSINDQYFQTIINDSIVILDSFGVCYLYGKKNGIKIEPLNGIDLAEFLISQGYRIFILGTTEDNIIRAVDNLKVRYPNCEIVGYHNGYFDDDEKVIEKINHANVDCLLVGMGSPKQEKWIYQNKSKLFFGVAMGIGGSIDVWAGKFKRAPYIFRKLRLEWLYRILIDLKRVPRVSKLVKFILLNSLGRL